MRATYSNLLTIRNIKQLFLEQNTYWAAYLDLRWSRKTTQNKK